MVNPLSILQESNGAEKFIELHEGFPANHVWASWRYQDFSHMTEDKLPKKCDVPHGREISQKDVYEWESRGTIWMRDFPAVFDYRRVVEIQPVFGGSRWQ